MKRLTFLFIFSFLLFLGCVGNVLAEEISSYHVSQDIHKDGNVAVTETITYDFGNEQRHGIFRFIPLIKKNVNGKEYVMDVTDVSVTDSSGKPYPVNINNSSGKLELKIGDPDRTITGEHTYKISYLVSGALTYFEDHDELYWNVTGSEWDVPIRTVEAKVTLPQDIAMSQTQTACYTGGFGSTESDCFANMNGQTISFRTQRFLENNEGMTLVVGFPPGIVEVVEPKPYKSFFDYPLVSFITTVLAFLWYIAAPAYILYRWYKQGRDPKSTVGQAHVSFAVPKLPNKRELSPAELSLLLHESLQPKAVSGTIVDLAHKGFVTFEQDTKTIFLNKTQKDGGLLPHEVEVYAALFKNGERIDVKKLSLYSTFMDIQQSLNVYAVVHGLFVKNPQKQREFYTILTVFAFFTGNIFLMIASVLFGRNMPKRTQLGTDLAAMGRALKSFLSSQERQYTFQAEEFYLFEKMLPYAVALGVEKRWAERFANGSVPPPSWYKGNSFTPLLLATSLNSSFSTMERGMSGSSSTGHSSGFSGGFSGGGGGGGGGGSW